MAETRALATCCEFWRGFDLDTRRLALDKQGLELQEGKEASVGARKRLAESTKQFRRNDEAAKVLGVRTLMKSYQDEIDELTKRCQFARNAFFGLYKALLDAPDPSPALGVALGSRARAQEAELEAAKLRCELEEYEKEFSQLKNQDVTVRRLEDQLLEMQDGMEQRVEEAVEARSAALREEAFAQTEEADARAGELQRQLEDKQRMLDEKETAADRTNQEFFNEGQSSEAKAAAFRAEYELLEQSSERLQQENQMLRAKLEASGDGGDGGNPLHTLAAVTIHDGVTNDAARAAAAAPRPLVQKLESELMEQSGLIARLREQVVHGEESLAALTEAHEAALQHAHEEQAGAKATIAELRSALASCPSPEEYRSLRHQVKIMQKLEFNVVDDAEDGDKLMVPPSQSSQQSQRITPNPDGGGESGRDPEDTAGIAERRTEQLLLTRVRRLEGENTAVKRQLGDTNTALEAAVHRAAKAEGLAEERLQLTRRLEDDLATSGGGGGGGDVGTSSSGGGGNSGRGQAEDLSQLLVQVTSPGSSSGGSNVQGAGQQLQRPPPSPRDQEEARGAGEQQTLLSVVQAQRDRFRQRSKELESEREALQRDVEHTRQSAEQLRAENLQLYEKVRYLQAYTSAGDGHGSSIHSSLDHRSSLMEAGVASDAALDLDAKYRGLYEDKIDPFVEFSKRERARRYDGLTLAEKITLTTTQAFVSNKTARTFVFFYVLTMHLLVFFTLYHYTHGKAYCH